MKDHTVIGNLYEQQEELFNAVYNEGYGRGYKDGKDEAYKNPTYNKGLEDAWECVRKIALNQCDGGIDINILSRIFGVGSDVSYRIFREFSVQEAIDKIKAWEEKQEYANVEIKIGDVVNAPGFHAPVVVIALYDDSVKVMSSSGETGVHPKYNIIKTDRHFDQISEVLEQLKTV